MLLCLLAVLTNAVSPKPCLGGDSTADGANIVLRTGTVTNGMKWKVEKGDMDILVGASSQDIRLTGRFTVSEDAFVDGRTRGFYADTTIE